MVVLINLFSSDEAHAVSYIKHIHKTVTGQPFGTTRLAPDEPEPQPKHIPRIDYVDLYESHSAMTLDFPPQPSIQLSPAQLQAYLPIGPDSTRISDE